MGTWGDGLYDNDSALDVVGDVVDSVALDRDAAHFAVGLGLILWMNPTRLIVKNSPTLAVIRKRPDLIDALPPDAKAVVDDVIAMPDAVAELDGDRSDEVRAVVGSYCDGRRYDALFGVPGARAVVDKLAGACIEHVDAALRSETQLYELAGALAHLGVLLDLAGVGVRVPAATLDAWRAAFRAADAHTTEERSFWDTYVSRVLPAFDLLARP